MTDKDAVTVRDPRQQAAAAAAAPPGAARREEPSAECPACGADHILVTTGGSARCGVCGRRLAEVIDAKTGLSAGYGVIEGPPTYATTERGLLGS